MKCFLSKLLGVALVSTVAGMGAALAGEGVGAVDFGKFSPAESGAEFVEVNVNSNLVSMVTRLAKASEPEVAEVLSGLHSIRVNVIGLDDKNREQVEARVKSIRADLDSKGWESVVTAQDHDQDVRVYVKLRGSEAVEGILVTVIDGGKQAVLVNVVGDVKPEKLALIGERFNIEPLKKIGPALKKS